MRVEMRGADAVWLPSDIDVPQDQMEKVLERYITDPLWFFQKKEDGVHVLASRNKAGKVDTRNRKGGLHGVPMPLIRLLAQMAPETMLDGEKLHEGGFVVFDMLYEAGRDLRLLPYGERLLAILEWYTKFVESTRSGLIRVIETAVDTTTKRALAKRLRAQNAEGFIIKSAKAPYTPGRWEDWRMNTMLRVKFTKSMSVLVERRNGGDTKASFEMYLLDANKEWRNIGTVSAQQFYKRLEPGQRAIAEVTYLYATPENAVVQPRLKRPDPFRSDKALEECTLSQLVIGGRFARA